MEHTKWHNVLVEWVNCLKLCKCVHDINELRSGEFFANLQKVITKSCEVQPDILTFMFELFGRHYPNHLIDNKSEIHLSDLPERDLRAITSLLMHYTCIFDRRDVLTSPLCHSLSQTTQLIIRNFLQKVNKSVTNDTMNDIIKSCIDDASDHLTNQWLSMDSSSTNSPLQDLLKTPISKFGRLQEKDRIITKLKSELELERYEKGDLQEELKQQNDKNRKIENQLLQKNNEITRLRGEVLALENRTPPHYQDMDSRELQRRLRAEIQTLEQYIQHIEDEQEEVKQEKDAAKEQLRKLESQSTIWQEKFFETERNFESLTELSKQREEELSNLQAHCSELTALLNEYRSKPANDSSFFESFSSGGDGRGPNETLPCEDLACSVVEVQLRDSQKQNEELRAQIGRAEETAGQLRQQAEEVGAELKRSREECGSLHDLNDRLIMKVESLEFEYETVHKQLSESKNNLEVATRQTQQLSDERTSLREELNETKTFASICGRDLEAVRAENNKINNLLIKSQESLILLESQNQDLATRLEETNDIVELLKNNNEELLVKINTLESHNETIEKELSEATSNLESSKKESEQLKQTQMLLEKNLSDSEALSERLTTELKENQEILKKSHQEKEVLSSDLQESKTKNGELLVQTETLQKQLSETADWWKLANERCEQLRDAQSALEQQLSQAQEYSEKLTTELDELRLENQRLTEIEERCAILSDEKRSLLWQLQQSTDKSADLQSKNEESRSQIDDLRKQLTETTDSLESSNKHTEQLITIQRRLEKQLFETKTLTEKLMIELEFAQLENEAVIGQFESEKESLTSQLRQSDEKSRDLEKQLIDTSECLEASEQQSQRLSEAQSALEKRLDEMMEDSEKLRAELENDRLENRDLKEQLAASEECSVKLESQLRHSDEKRENLEKQLIDTISWLEVSNKQSERLADIQSALEKQLREVEEYSEKLRAELENAQLESGELEQQLEESQECAVKLESEKESVLSKLRQSDEKCQAVEKQLTDTVSSLNSIKKQLSETESHSEKLTTELDSVRLENEKINEHSEEIKQYSVKLESERDGLLSKLRLSDEKCQALEDQLSDTINCLEVSKQQSEKLSDAQSALEKQLRVVEDCSENLRTELESVQRKSEEIQEYSVKLEGERESLLSKLQQSDEKCRAVQEQLSDTINCLELSKQQSEKSNATQSVLEKQVNEAEARSEQLRTELEKVRLENETINGQLDQGKEYAAKLESEMGCLISQMQQLEEQCQTLRKQNTDDTSALEKQLHQAEACSEKLRLELDIAQTIGGQLDETKVYAMKLESEKEGLLVKLQQSNEAHDDLEMKNEVLRIHNETLQTQLAEAASNLKLSKKQSEELKQVESMLKTHLNEVAALSEKLRSDLQASQLETRNVTTELDETKESLKKLERLMDKQQRELNGNNSVLQKQLIETLNTLESSIKQSEDLKETRGLLEKQLSKAAAFSENLRIELDKVRRENLDAKEALIRVKSEKEALAQESEMMKRSNEELLLQTETIREELSDAINCLELGKNESEELRVIQGALEKQLREVEGYSEKLRTELVNVQLENRKTSEELDEVKECLAKEFQEKDSGWQRINEAEAKNRELLLENERLESLVSEASNRSKKAEEQLNETRAWLEKLRIEVGDVLIEKQRSEESAMKMENEKEVIMAKLQQSSAKYEELHVEIETLQEEFSETVNNMEMNKREVESALEKELNEARVLSERMRTELGKLKLEKEETSTEIEEIRRCSMRAEAENETLQNQLAELREQLGVYCQKCETLRVENEHLAKSLEDANLSLEESRLKIATLLEKLERLSEEKLGCEKKIEIDEFVASEIQEKVKSLEETVQDYAITISGLKSVIDNNLESLQNVKDAKSRLETELSDLESQRRDVMASVVQVLGIEAADEDLKTFICKQLTKLQSEKINLEGELEDLRIKNIAATKLNSSFQDMIGKLQALVMDQGELNSAEALKSSFKIIHDKITEALQIKQKLESDKLELIKQLETIKIDIGGILETKAQLESNNNALEQTLKEERERIKALTGQKEALIRDLDNIKPVKPEKENVLGVSTKSNKSREEELKKDNMLLKKKLVLTENAKSNLEKVLKELRQKKSDDGSGDAIYKKLLQEYIQVREEHERVVKEKNAELDDKKSELQSIRQAYGSAMAVNAKLELENSTLKKSIAQLDMKETYEKLLEENNRLSTEIDTIKYKRIRDKEEFVRLLKKDREDTLSRETKRVQDIRMEYEGKLEKMKEKMLKLYREEVNKKVQSAKGRNENTTLLKTVGNLRSELFEADQRIQMLEMEKQIWKSNKNSEVMALPGVGRKASTLPRAIMEEVTMSRRTSISALPTGIGDNLQMEDEEDLFNDKYLADLKEGRCNSFPATGRESTSRFSELAWRNSLCPPHLKSSYPAELQFVSPSQFKDEDIKAGNIEFEDSLCKLLPGEKPRKKDFGTTSYKKPGPPTPSKNGGRLSLQGNEVHPLREHCEAKTPKRSTPSRIRALFTGRNSSTNNSTREASESHNTTPNRGKRLNIFRRPK